MIRANIAHESALMTDEGTYYREVGREFARHETVNHREDEYVRGDAYVKYGRKFFLNLQERNARRVSALR